MDYSYTLSQSVHHHHRLLHFSPSISKPFSSLKPTTFSSSSSTSCTFHNRKVQSLVAVVASAGAGHCEFGCLNTPLEPKSPAGKSLNSVLLNQRQSFHAAVHEELKQLADDRDAAINRMVLSSGSDEASLHRRIAQLKEHDCQAAVQDIMYMLILFKFSEMRVPLVPKLSRCIYNGRLEIWPSKDWQLESIYDFEVLEMIREHIRTVIGLRANSSVTESWATTEIKRLHLGQVYAASILYGYFLKSASVRHHLEQCFALPHQDLYLRHRASLQFPEMWPYGLKNLVYGRINNMQSVSLCQGSSRQECKQEKLKCYVMGFDPETLQRCAKLKSKEAENLIREYSCALFGDERTGSLETDDVILTSFSSLKRLVLEAVAFGSFLWEIEEYIDSVYKLKEN